MTKIGLVFTIILLLGCEKPNPTPEVADAIYLDLTARAENASKSIEAEEKKLETLKKDMEHAKPYSGDLKIAQKRYFESERKIQGLRQDKAYFTLHSKSRKFAVREAYNKTFGTKTPFDTSEDAKSYKEFDRMTKINPSWDSKRRIATYTAETGLGKREGPGEKAEPKKETKESKEPKKE